MSQDISYQNKDVCCKVLAENLRGKSLDVYGLCLPKVVELLPTNLPKIFANELRIDNLFRLADGSVAILDYESDYKEENKLKYLSYIVRVLERYRKSLTQVKIRMIVIYTADVTPEQTSNQLDAGAIHLEIESAYLLELDSEQIMEKLENKVNAGEALTDEEMLEFIILPLTYKGKDNKVEAVDKVFSLAKKIADEETATFVLSGIIVFTDKIIDREQSERMAEDILMTKVGEFYQEKIDQAVEHAVSERDEQHKAEIAGREAYEAQLEAENTQLLAENARLKAEVSKYKESSR